MKSNKKQIDSLKYLLNDFDPITLEEMSEIRLMNRNDSKYLTTLPKLFELMREMKSEYYVQETNNTRLIPYQTDYYDTKDKEMYKTHIHGKLVRSKVRVRTYVDSNISFLEVKNKNNKGFTIKKRVKIKAPWIDLSDEETNFLEDTSGYNCSDLEKQLKNSFYRITFVNKKKTERVTIDTFLKFDNVTAKNQAELSSLVIIELKRDGKIFSPLIKILNKLRIKSSGFSKYCMGMALTDITNKANLIKSRVKYVNKMISSDKY